jgi:hypothetical protein
MLHDPISVSLSASRVAIFEVLYLLESWKLDCTCHPDCRARFLGHLGAHVV